MPKIQYEKINIHGYGLGLIEKVNEIIDDYSEQGYSLTLRQVYYQLVSRAIIENSERSYKNIGELINKGRITGLIDWNAIEDRTRNLRRLSQWDSPRAIIETAARSYHINYWKDQPCYVEVWVEKDALIGIVEQASERLDVPCFSCRGYTSQSEMWTAAMRFKGKERNGKDCYIIHLGDHDPSGIDMTRDIEDRLEFFGASVSVKRIALNLDQIKKFNPPPNPAKITDSRAESYIKKFGKTSWELDALEPGEIDRLITKTIEKYMDKKLYHEAGIREDEERTRIYHLIDMEFPEDEEDDSDGGPRDKDDDE
jgi:hypothetical protein